MRHPFWLLHCSALLLLMTTSACQQQGLSTFSWRLPPGAALTGSNQRPAPLPQDPSIQVYFNHDPSVEYTEPYRRQTRLGDNLEQEIIDTITAAKSTVDVAVMELRLPKIAQALVNRQQAGVKVRVILDKTYNHPLTLPLEAVAISARERDRDESDRQLVQLSGDALKILHDGRVPIIDNAASGSTGSGIMHHKFVIVDGRTLIVTSANFTAKQIHGAMNHPESQGDANNLLKIESSQLAALFSQEFNFMWGHGSGDQPETKRFGLLKPFRPIQPVQVGNTLIEVNFSPTSSNQPWEQSGNGLIGQTLSTARKSIDLALFVFSAPRLADILEVDHQQGVEERTLISQDFAYRPYSEGLVMQGLTSRSCKYKAWQNPIATVGVPQLPQGELLHHKFAVIDGQTVITGSHNWSEAANTKNDEDLLVIHNSTVAAHFEREFERLYVNAELGVPDKIKRKIQHSHTRCFTKATASPLDKEPAFAD
ncbi:MAG: phosphatidylserine/phosphatidylglycerophosphate/cardiolipin synthase family protein [Chroococcidiopsidaceae cyanobacterium CP_BM_RX_35]|nr:phosphatidylserine/phosphatidylglycerophosphate/cardiolipin synthase family protein [Chroococcidiopsidaceae cyanobacterium CP_BM_RX_35]